MISLDLDVYKLVQNYGINLNLSNASAYSSINSYSQGDSSESASGVKGTSGAKGTSSTNNANQANDPTISVNDLSEENVVDILHLVSPNDRLVVLNHLPQADLNNILPLLNKDQMALGLKFFTKDALLNTISGLSKEDIVKIITQIYANPQEILGYINQKDVNTILTSQKISQDDYKNQLQSLPLSQLAQIYEAATGTPAGNKNQSQLLNMFKDVNREFMVEGVESLPFKQQMSMVSNLTAQNTGLLQSLPVTSMMHPVEEASKTDITNGMTALTTDQLIKQLEQLPQNLLAQVATQLDPDRLATYLLKNNPEIIAQLAS